MAETIPHWLYKQAYLSPSHPAIELENGDVITFKQLHEASTTFARKLSTLGIEKGDHIGVFSTNQVSMIVAIHALSYLGAVSVLLNIRLTKPELDYQIKDGDVKLILVSDDLETHAKLMQFAVSTISFSEVSTLAEKDISLRTEISLQDPYSIMYTSGTTGFPKGVVHTFGNHYWSAMGSALNLGLHQNDKWLSVLPMFHIGGLSIYIRSVIYGMPVYLLEKFDEAAFQKAVMEKGVTIASVVTVMVQRLLKYLENEKYPDTFRCMLLGGGAAPKSLLEKAKAHNIPVFQSYGMTETASQIVTLSPDDALKQFGSSGKPLFPAQLKIVNPAADGIGEIFVKGPMVTRGYYNKPEANQEAFHGDWLATGDLGYLENGFLYVVERRKDLIISGGENIYPTEIEHVMSSIKEIREVGVVGVPHEEWGQVPVAFVVRETPISPEQILNDLKQRLASYKLPKQIFFVDELPRNASNKLMRRKLLDLYHEISEKN